MSTDRMKRLLDLEPIQAGAGMQTPGSQPLRLRFGDVAVSLGYARRMDVEAALAVQHLDRIGGRPHRLLGQLLVDLNVMTQTQVSQVLEVLVQENCPNLNLVINSLGPAA